MGMVAVFLGTVGLGWVAAAPPGFMMSEASGASITPPYDATRLGQANSPQLVTWQSTERTDTNPASETLTQCLQGARQYGADDQIVDLYLLLLLDESGSLRSRDPDNARVEGVQKAVEGLSQLRSRLQQEEVPFEFHVAIHGFGSTYNSYSDFVSIDDGNSLDNLRRQAAAFTVRNKDSLTDYRKAFAGTDEILRSQPGVEIGSACALLVIFTDGEYDTDNRPGLTDQERQEITTELCRDGGSVDQLRMLGVPVLAVGLTSGNQADFDLLQAIATGEGNGDWSSCGAIPGTGELHTVERVNLPNLLEYAILDSVYAGSQDLPNRQLCESNSSEASAKCVREFELKPWTREFTLYVELPYQPNVQPTVALISPDDNTIALAPNYGEQPVRSPGLPFVEVDAPSPGWRRFHGQRPEGKQNWVGTWLLEVTGQQALSGLVLRHDIDIMIDTNTRVSRTDSNSINNVIGRLTPTGEQVTPDQWRGHRLSIETRAMRPSSDYQGSDTSVYLEVQPGSPIIATVTVDENGTFPIPENFLQQLLNSHAQLIRYDIEFQILESIEHPQPDIEHRYDPNIDTLLIYDPITIQILPAPDEIVLNDDTAPVTSVFANLISRDKSVQHPGSVWWIEASVDLPEQTLTWTSPTIPSTEPVSLRDMFESFSETIDPNPLIWPITLNPVLSVANSAHPATVPTNQNFRSYPGDGLPYIQAARITGFNDLKSGQIELEIGMPGTTGSAGMGTVQISSLSGLPDNLPGELKLLEPVICEVSAGATATCEASLESSFTANRDFSVYLDLVLSSNLTDQTTSGPVPVLVDMNRPLNKWRFSLISLLLLVGFTLIQIGLRVFYTFKLVKWEALPIDSRLAELNVKIQPDSRIVSTDDSIPAITIDDTQFASGFQARASKTTVVGVNFWIDWRETFVKQHTLIRASASDGSHCISTNGYETSGSSIVGKVGTDFRDLWVLKMPNSALASLISGSETDALLLLVLMRDERDFVDDLTSQSVSDAQAYIAKLIEDQAKWPTIEPAGTSSIQQADGATSKTREALPERDLPSPIESEDDGNDLDNWNPDDPFA